MLLSTMHGHICPISGNRCRGGGPVAPYLATGLYVSPRRGESMPRGSGDPVLMLQGSGEAKIIPDEAQGSSALMTSWGLGKAKGVSKPRTI
jgi:hypothetical protein